MQELPLSSSLFNPKVAYTEAQRLYKKGDFIQAVAYFLKVATYWKEASEKTTDPKKRSKILGNLSIALYNLGSTELVIGELNRAEDHLREAVEYRQALPEEKDKNNYQRRHQKAYLYKTMAAFQLVRHSGKAGVPPKTFSYYQWYQLNFISLKEAFDNCYPNLVDVLKKLPMDQRYCIVSLGCGLAEEVFALLEILGEELFQKIYFVGIDPGLVDQTAENQVKQKTANKQLADIFKASNYTNVIFSTIDGSNAQGVKDLLPAGTAELILFRHPCFFEKAPGVSSDFPKILSETVPSIAKQNGESSIFILTYLEIELTQCLHHLSKGGMLDVNQCISVGDGRYLSKFKKREEKLYSGGLVESSLTDKALYPDRISFLSTYRPGLIAEEKLASGKIPKINQKDHHASSLPSMEPVALSSNKKTKLESVEAKPEEKSQVKNADKSPASICSKLGVFATVTAVAASAAVTMIVQASYRK